MTLTEAFTLLENIPNDFTLESLSDLANLFSVEDIDAIEGASTHFYTKVNLIQFIEESGNSIRVIDNSEVAELLTYDGLFRRAVYSIQSISSRTVVGYDYYG